MKNLRLHLLSASIGVNIINKFKPTFLKLLTLKNGLFECFFEFQLTILVITEMLNLEKNML